MRRAIFVAALTALSLASQAFAAETLEEAFKQGKFDGHLRAHYLYTDWIDETTTGKYAKDAKGFAIGGSFLYKTAPLYGISAGAGLYTTQNPGGWTSADDGTTATTSQDLFYRTSTGKEYGKGYAVLGQAYLQADFFSTQLKVGQMLITNPFVTPNDTKMIPSTVEGVELTTKAIPDTEMTAVYMTAIKERGRTDFGNLTNTGDTPDKIKLTKSPTTGKNIDYSTIIGIKNSSLPWMDVQLWGLVIPEIAQQIMTEANLKFGSATLGARYIKQIDKGAGAIIKPATNNNDDDNSIDTDMLAIRAIAKVAMVKFLLAHSQTSEEGDLLAMWRGFPTEGYTRSMTQTDWNADTKANKVAVDFDFTTLGLIGFSATTSYSLYDRNPNKTPYQAMTNRGYQNGDTKQFNLDLIQKIAFARGAEFKIRLMDQQNDATLLQTKDTSNREMRIEFNCYF